MTEILTNARNKQTETLTVRISVIFTPADEQHDEYREFQLTSIEPRCPKPCPNPDELCPACWLEEFTKCIGIEPALLEGIELPATDCFVALTGHMWADYREDSFSGGWDGDEGFEVESFEVVKFRLPHERYIAALKRQRGRIASGVPLELDDCNITGCKSTSATWGLCSNEKEAWPHAEDHLWPDQFQNHGRVAPLYLGRDQWCPFDLRQSVQRYIDGKEGSGNDATLRLVVAEAGCFYRCRLFQARHIQKHKGEPMPDQKRALQLYDDLIERK